MCEATAFTSQPGRSVGVDHSSLGQLLEQVGEVVDRLPPDVDVRAEQLLVRHALHPMRGRCTASTATSSASCSSDEVAEDGVEEVVDAERLVPLRGVGQPGQADGDGPRRGARRGRRCRAAASPRGAARTVLSRALGVGLHAHHQVRRAVVEEGRRRRRR